MLAPLSRRCHAKRWLNRQPLKALSCNGVVAPWECEWSDWDLQRDNIDVLAQLPGLSLSCENEQVLAMRLIFSYDSTGVYKFWLDWVPHAIPRSYARKGRRFEVNGIITMCYQHIVRTTWHHYVVRNAEAAAAWRCAVFKFNTIAWLEAMTQSQLICDADTHIAIEPCACDNACTITWLLGSKCWRILRLFRDHISLTVMY